MLAAPGTTIAGMRRGGVFVAGIALLSLLAPFAGSARSSTDPLCVRSYGGGPPHPRASLRFGVDPDIAGSAGAKQTPSAPDNPALDFGALKALRPPGRVLVVRLSRLFWAAGNADIAKVRHVARRYTSAGFEVELQVRYHPPAGQAGHLRAWESYVRRVVDAFGPDRRVVAMTITNEVNVTFSPNTSDGYYLRATDALIGGVEAAHSEAVRRGFSQLRFGFTYAYRFVPSQDAAFFAYLGAHGGRALATALGFVGLDFYPGSLYPAVLPSGGYRAALAEAAGVVRRCLAPKAGIGPRVPIWLTENGVPTVATAQTTRQAAALTTLVRAAHDYAGTFNITDYRWFNLRDSGAPNPAALFATDGLLRANYTRKPSFSAYRRLIAQLGERAGP